MIIALVNVSWQPGNGATPGGPGMIYQLPAGQDTTTPLNYTVSLQSGWGGGSPDYNGPVNVSIPPGVNEGCSLVDAQGNSVQSVVCFLAHGTGASQARVKVTAPSMPGGSFKDIGLIATLPDGSASGGQSNNLRVYLAAAPPTTKVTWEVKVNGQSLGYVLQTNQSDNVTFHRNGAMVWPNYIPGA